MNLKRRRYGKWDDFMPNDKGNTTQYVGLNIGAHDSSCSVIEIEDRKVISKTVALEERFTKIRYQGNFPLFSMKQLFLHDNNFKICSGNHIAINSYGAHPRAWEKNISVKAPYIEALDKLGLSHFSSLNNSNISFFSHHLCHAYSLLVDYPFDESLIFVIDGSGSELEVIEDDFKKPELNIANEQLKSNSRESISVYYQKGFDLKCVFKSFHNLLDFPDAKTQFLNSIGGLYEAGSIEIFKSERFAGKVMGLSAYGKVLDQFNRLDSFSRFAKKIKNNEKNFHFENFNTLEPSEFSSYADIAASYQHLFEEDMFSLIKKVRDSFPSIRNISITGGCALNCIFNAKLANLNLFDNIYIPPYPNDEGISLGATTALALKNDELDFASKNISQIDPFLGIRYALPSSQRVQELFKNYKIDEISDLNIVVDKILNNEVVAVYQSRSETGPRALGHRSLLALPNRNDLKDYLNQNIKFRENFRPYGLSILKDHVGDYFYLPDSIYSPFMSFAPKAKSALSDRIQACVHVDQTCRIQSVDKDSNNWLFHLLTLVHQRSMIPALLNTSLNVNKQPILETLEDALMFFDSSKVAVMVLDNFLITKS